MKRFSDCGILVTCGFRLRTLLKVRVGSGAALISAEFSGQSHLAIVIKIHDTAEKQATTRGSV